MKKLGVIIFVVALAVGVVIANMFSFGRSAASLFNISLHIGGVHGSGNLGTDIRRVDGFEAVDVGGVFQVEITAQKDFRVEVEADDNLLPFISTEVVNGTLKIETEKRLKTSNPIRIRIYAPNIDSLDVSGAANVNVSGLDNTSLAVDSSGASKIKLGGRTNKLTVDVSGATKIDADELKTIDAMVEASGASHVNVNVSGELRTDASGASRIVYSGDPSSVSTKASGASSVTEK
jgi:hypothetical protein